MWNGLIRLMIRSSSGNNPSGFIKGEKGPDYLRGYVLLRTVLTVGGVMKFFTELPVNTSKASSPPIAPLYQRGKPGGYVIILLLLL